MPRYSMRRRGTDLQLADLSRGLRPTVRFHVTDHHVDALPSKPVPFLEHLERFSDPRSKSEIDLQPATLLAANEVKEHLGFGLQFVGRHRAHIWECPARAGSST